MAISAMITLHAEGGLGNQLFNYAAARSLADRHGTDLVVDAAAYRNQWRADSMRPFALNRFPVRARFRNMGPDQERRPFLARVARRLREDAFAHAVDRRGREIGFFTGFQQLGRRTVLRGHYISKLFFASNESRIRRDLQLDDRVLEGDKRLLEVLAAIRSGDNPVAVHIRRGDLLMSSNAWLRLPNIEQYYRRAFQRLASGLHRLSLWVFSDDPAWCRQSLDPGSLRMSVVTCEQLDDPVRDFYLMSQCAHFVIANSAFSWWAAWLGAFPGKHVLAPYLWDADGAICVPDLLPSDWTLIRW